MCSVRQVSAGNQQRVMLAGFAVDENKNTERVPVGLLEPGNCEEASIYMYILVHSEVN